MLDQKLQARFAQLLDVKVTERRRLFPQELGQFDAQAAARGMFQSSAHAHRIHHAHQHELDVRAILSWESLVRVHRTFGQPMSDTLRDDLKAEIHSHIDQAMAELTDSMNERLKKIRINTSVSLIDSYNVTLKKHDVEIDLYVDSLSESTGSESAMTQNYNFYGAIGSVQTGANATANIVQNLGADDRASLISAIQQVRDALTQAPSFGDQQRRELLEVADECVTQISNDSPNNTKLLTMFSVLGTAIQSIASAQPAYQALKLAVLPLGITLP